MNAFMIQLAQHYPNYSLSGEVYDRIPYGSDDESRGATLPCSGCDVATSRFHVLGCDMEQCPACGFAALFCGCDNLDIGAFNRRLEAYRTGGRIALTDDHVDSWLCLCGNRAIDEGFRPCNSKGIEVEPTTGWPGLYLCGRCGRIIEQQSLRIVGQNRPHNLTKSVGSDFRQ